MAKTICKMVKKEEHVEETEGYLKVILPAKFICKKCGRTSSKKVYLCKPKKVPDK